MNRKRIKIDLDRFPLEFVPLLKDTDVYDSSCSPEARVFFVDCDGGYYLKESPKGTLQKEADMTRFFHKKGLGTEVLAYQSAGDRDWLLTRRVPGEDCTHADYLADPRRLCDLLASLLRSLHETDTAECPVADRMSAYLSTAENNYRLGQWDLSYYTQDYGDVTPQQLWHTVKEGGEAFARDTLLHGDYCLPNVMLDNWRFAGFIDLGNGGVGDRHVDLYWGAWTLRFNLKTDCYRERFFDAYGRDKIDPELLRLVAAAEVFG